MNLQLVVVLRNWRIYELPVHAQTACKVQLGESQLMWATSPQSITVGHACTVRPNTFGTLNIY